MQVGNFTDQQRSRSTVQFASGFAGFAGAIARALGIVPVRPLEPGTRDLASGAPVVVVLGENVVRMR